MGDLPTSHAAPSYVVSSNQVANSEAAKTSRKGAFGRDVLKLATGTVFGQALTILISPFLTRLFAPEAFGLATLFTSITAILSVIACLRYELAIVLPKRDEDAVNVLGLSIASAIAIVIFISTVFAIGAKPILNALNASGLMPYVWLIPIAIIVQAFFLAFRYWHTRKRHFGRLSAAMVLQSLFANSGKLLAGYVGYLGGGALIVTTMFGQCVMTCALGWQILRHDAKLIVRHLRWQAMIDKMKRYRKFPLISTWSALLNTVSLQLPALLLTTFFSPAEVGFYALGYRILKMPMQLVGSAIGQVFFQRATVAKNDGNLSKVVFDTGLRLVLIGGFPIFALMILGPQIFAFAFGEEWIEAGVYVRILGPWIFFVFLGSPISTLNSVLEKQGLGLKFNIIMTASRAASLIIGGIYKDPRWALMLFSFSGSLLWAWYCLHMVGLSGQRRILFLAASLKKIIPALIFLIPVCVALWLCSNTVVVLSVSLSCCATYYSYLIYSDGEIRALIPFFNKGEES